MIQSGPQGDIIDRVAARVQRTRTWLHARMAPAARFGSPANMSVGAVAGVAAFAGALLSWPAASAPASVARADFGPAVVDMTPISAPAPVGAPPPPPLQLALDYDVAFFWPKTPQTVAEPVAIREGPAGYAKTIRSARPGERLRINGRVDDAPDGPWLRVRLEDGRDGYFAARTIDVGSYRRPPAAAPAADDAAPLEGEPGVTAGAPLIVAGPTSEPDGPPSF
ncbi:MAG: hypothetical protein FD160_2211 [Caulobacteraceae bacterium]|nr:MAG: hypothetical protein FD160_2211 [Caulobacteraceae bacterium]